MTDISGPLKNYRNKESEYNGCFWLRRQNGKKGGFYTETKMF